MAALLLNACNHPGENKKPDADGNNSATSSLLIVDFKPTFKPATAKTDATFAIQAIDPTTGADLSAAAEVFDTKFGHSELVFQTEATTSHPHTKGLCICQYRDSGISASS